MGKKGYFGDSQYMQLNTPIVYLPIRDQPKINRRYMPSHTVVDVMASISCLEVMVRGYHVYCDIWQAFRNEILQEAREALCVFLVQYWKQEHIMRATVRKVGAGIAHAFN